MEKTVLLKDMLSKLKECEFKDVVIPMGVNEKGEYVYENLLKMNHIFVAGVTGSGKSVFLHNVILSLTKQLSASKLDLVLIDPKRTEFAGYKEKNYYCVDGIKQDEFSNLFDDLINEMERRFLLFVKSDVKNIDEYNELEQSRDNPLKHIVVIIDEYADLAIIDNGKLTEQMIKLLQKCRASGINFVVATQRPSIIDDDKNLLNYFPTHVAFTLFSDKDSEVVMQSQEATKLKRCGNAIIDTPSKQYKVQTPYMLFEEIIETIRENDDSSLPYLTNYLSKKVEVNDNCIPKISLLNITKENFVDKLSKNICLYEFNDLLNGAEMHILNNEVLCIVYDEEKYMQGEQIKHLIDKANEKKINIFKLSIKDKRVDEIAELCNEISSLIYEPALINIEAEDFKGKEIVDGFVIKRKEGIDLQKEYIDLLEKFMKKNPNTSQIVMSISGGYDAKLEEIYKFVKVSQKNLPKDMNIIFGCGMNENEKGIYKISIILQTGGKRKEKVSENNNSYEGIEQVKSIEEEVHDSEFYKSKIEEFCQYEIISCSTVQRYLRFGYPRAAKLIDEWEANGYVEKTDRQYKVVDKEKIRESLNEILKEKL